MQNVSVVTKPKIDILSIILSTLGFGGVVFAFSSAGESGWGSATVLVSIIVGGLALGLFCLAPTNNGKTFDGLESI